MAEKTKDMWLKVLIGFVLSLILLSFGFTAAGLDKKVDKDVFNEHKEKLTTQFGYIKESLERIEGIKND